MYTFFHGWRRKAGVVTLVMACVFTVAWGRSHLYEDDACLAVSRRQAVAIQTRVGCIAIVLEWQELPEDGIVVPQMFSASETFNWVARPALHVSGVDPWGITLWYWRLGNFGFGELEGEAGLRLLAIPYWSLALPLTLLSAYLILWKPRKRAT